MPEPQKTPAPGQAVIDPNAAAGAAGAAGAPTPAQTPEGQTVDGQKMVPLPALHEAREEIKTLRAEIEAVRALNNPQQQQQQFGGPYQQQQQQYPQADVTQQLENLWDEDPRRAMQAEVMMALNWYDATNADLDTQEQQLEAKYPDFATYRADIRRYMRSVPVTDRAKPGMVESAYYFVKGRGADNALKAHEEEIMKKIRAGESVQGLNYGATPASATPPAQQAQATADQAKAAAAMGMSTEDYMKHVRMT